MDYKNEEDRKRQKQLADAKENNEILFELPDNLNEKEKLI